MTDRQSNDDTLKAAFQALGETSHGEISAADLDLIWRAVSGELPASERRELVDRTATDPALAEAWRAARELRHAAGMLDCASGPGPEQPPPRCHRRRAT